MINTGNCFRMSLGDGHVVLYILFHLFEVLFRLKTRQTVCPVHNNNTYYMKQNKYKCTITLRGWVFRRNANLYGYVFLLKSITRDLLYCATIIHIGTYHYAQSKMLCSINVPFSSGTYFSGSVPYNTTRGVTRKAKPRE